MGAEQLMNEIDEEIPVGKALLDILFRIKLKKLENVVALDTGLYLINIYL